MPDPIQTFLDVAKDNKVDKKLLESSFVEKTLDKLESCGKDVCESVKSWVKNPPLKPASPTPTYEESAFVKPKKETSLYNVTNRENEAPLIRRASKLFKDLDYSVRGLNVSAIYKNEEKEYSLIAGEKVGLGYENKSGQLVSGVKGTVNVGNGKSSLEYYSRNPANSYTISVYHQDKNTGVYAGYSNVKGLNSAFSADKNSASLSCSYNKKYEQCNLSIGGYFTSGDNYSNPFVGVSGRITF